MGIELRVPKSETEIAQARRPLLARLFSSSVETESSVMVDGKRQTKNETILPKFSRRYLASSVDRPEISGTNLPVTTIDAPAKHKLQEFVVSQKSLTEKSQNEMKEFLRDSGLASYVDAFIEFGIESIEELEDPDLVNDESLINEVGFTPREVNILKQQIILRKLALEEPASATVAQNGEPKPRSGFFENIFGDSDE